MTYDLWLRSIRPIALTESQLIATAPPKTLPWLNRRYHALLHRAAAAATPRSLSLALQPAPPNTDVPAPPIEPFSTRNPPPSLRNTQSTIHVPQLHTDHLNPLHTFSTFVIGPSNHFAHTAALAVAESPASTYNPFILYGPPGLGKTHLLHAITHFITAHNPTMTVIYTTADRFTATFVSSIKTNTLDAFQTQLRTADVMLIDNVHAFDNKRQTQKELLHTIDHLIQLDKQVILSINSPPHECDGLIASLKLTLQSGLRVDLEPPDLDTRLAILHKQTSQDSIDIEHPDALLSLAQSVPANPRTLLAALVRVTAFASLTRRPVTPSLVAEVTSSLYPRLQPATTISLDRIIHLTARASNLAPTDLLGSSRKADIVRSRHIAMYLARQLTDLSLPRIGTHFGGRDHATVLHASRKITDQIKSSATLNRSVNNLVLELQSSS